MISAVRWRRFAHGLVVAALSASATAPRCMAGIAFQQRADLAVGGGPTAVALLPGGSPTLLVARGDGIAAFRYRDEALEPGPRSSNGRGAQIVVTGPLAADGGPAVAYGARDGARIAVAPVDARGGLGTPEILELPSLPRAAAVASFDPSAPAALVVAHDEGVSVLTRGGAGWQRIETAAPKFPRDLAVGDVNGDGRVDLVIADDASSQLAILSGAGNGTFGAVQRVATVRRPQRVVVAEVTGDRVPDVVVIGDDALAIHAGSATGLGAAQIVDRGNHVADVAVADVNGDGRPDLALLDRGRSMVQLLFGAGGGAFTPGDGYLVGAGADALLLGDLDGDRQIDVLTLNRVGDSATVLHGRGGGVFDGVICLRGELGQLTAVAVDDFDRDEHPDLAVASEDSGRVELFLGRGGGRFSARPPINVGRQPRAMVAGDFDQDDNPDLAVVNFGGDAVAILRGDGRGGFSDPQLIHVGTGPNAISTGSFSSDTSVDLAVVNSLSNTVSVLYGDGRGHFPDVATFPVAARSSFLIVGDTNLDGHQDLVVGSQFSESVAILLGDGHRLAAPSTNTLSAVAKPSQAEDFDRDGQMDLVNVDEAAGVVEILPGTSPGKFGTAIRLFVGRDPHAVATADFDRDGRIDIAVVHRTTQMIAILLNRSASPHPPPRSDRAARSAADRRS
jgi:hypothetical protein